MSLHNITIHWLMSGFTLLAALAFGAKWWNFKGKTRAGVYETLCPQHMLAPKDNLETRCQSRKRGIIQSNIYGNLPKVNRVIYTLDTYHDPSTSSSPDILLTRFHRFTMQSEKGDNSAKYS